MVDMDLEKFFDRVNHDVLMARVARRVKDKRLLRLLRRYLEAGVMVGGVSRTRRREHRREGRFRHCFPISSLMIWIRSWRRRGHRFCRYADDCNIYVRSKAAGERVMESHHAFLGEAAYA